MNMTSKDIIKVLPLGEELRQRLLNSYDHLTPDQEFEMEDILWSTYEALYKLRLEENMRIAREEAKNGQERLDNNLYKRVEELTEREMQSNEFKLSTEVDLEQARQKLLTLINNSPAKNN